MLVQIVPDLVESNSLDSGVLRWEAIIESPLRTRKVLLRDLVRLLPALGGQLCRRVEHIHRLDPVLRLLSGPALIHRTYNPRATSCRLRSRGREAFQMPKKLVTSLASLKSRHLEESELGGRGNHAVGEFVCAEGSVSKVQEIWYCPYTEQLLSLLQYQATLETIFKQGMHQKSRCIGQTHNHCWIVVVVFTRNILSWCKE